MSIGSKPHWLSATDCLLATPFEPFRYVTIPPESGVIGHYDVADIDRLEHHTRMLRWRWPIIVTVIAILASVCVAIYHIKRTEILAAACRAGLSNLSKPPQIPAEAIGCVVLGQKETVSGTIFSSDHGFSLFLAGHQRPIALWQNKISAPLLSQLKRSWLRYCIEGAAATVTGWRTTSHGRFGEMGYAEELFFVDTVDSVRPLPTPIIADARSGFTWCHDI